MEAFSFRPYLLKAGSSFALAALAAAYVYLRVAARKTENDNPESPSSSVRASNKLKDVDENAQEDEDFQSVESTACEEREKPNGDQVGLGLKEVILGLVDRINELRRREEELEARFQRYQSMKEYEGLLVELQNALRLEVARGDSLKKEVSSLEAEAMRARDCLRLLQQARNLEQENGVLKKKVKRLSRRCKEGARVVAEQRLRIQESEAMIMKSREEVAKGADLANKMDEEISELQLVVDGLRREKVELSDKLEIAEASLTLKHEGEIITIDEYKHIINELEKLQKEFAGEVNELVYLRWTNACLRHQLMQLHERDIDPGLVPAGEQHELLELDLHHELDRLAMEREKSASPEVKTERDSKRRALVKKLKGWVEGKHHGKMRVQASKNDAKRFGRHFASDWVEEHVHGKRSFVSA